MEEVEGEGHVDNRLAHIEKRISSLLHRFPVVFNVLVTLDHGVEGVDQEGVVKSKLT
jgi:hypothetical protein